MLCVKESGVVCMEMSLLDSRNTTKHENKLFKPSHYTLIDTFHIQYMCTIQGAEWSMLLACAAILL